MTVQVSVNPPSCVVTVITADPADTPVTTPFETVATEELLVDHETVLFVAFDGATVSVSVVVLPISTESVDLSSETPVTGTLLAVYVTVTSAP